MNFYSQYMKNQCKLSFFHFQLWHIHKFSVQPVPVSHHPHHKEFLPYAQFKPTLFQFKSVAPCSVTVGPDKRSFSIFTISLL